MCWVALIWSSYHYWSGARNQPPSRRSASHHRRSISPWVTGTRLVRPYKASRLSPFSTAPRPGKTPPAPSVAVQAVSTLPSPQHDTHPVSFRPGVSVAVRATLARRRTEEKLGEAGLKRRIESPARTLQRTAIPRHSPVPSRAGRGSGINGPPTRLARHRRPPSRSPTQPPQSQPQNLNPGLRAYP